MSRIRNLVYLVVIGMLLVSGCTTQAPATSLPGKSDTTATAAASKPPSTATPEPLPELDPVVQAAMKLCEKILPGQVCLAEGPVQVTAQSERYLMPFREPGQTLNLADIQTLKLGEAGSTKGLVVMRIQTEWPGGAFTAMAFGDVELVNEVPFGTREFNPMQSLKLTTGPNEEGQPPTSGFIVSSPEDGNLSTLVVNGAELSFGSTALLTSLQGGLTIQTVWGGVGVWLIDKLVGVLQGSRLDLTEQEIEQRGVDRDPGCDPAVKTLDAALRKFYGASANETWQEAALRQLRAEEARQGYDPASKTLEEALRRHYGASANETWQEAALRKVRAEEELRRKQKRWKGGWWKMTYGPVTVSGQCKTEAAGDRGTGGDRQPYTTGIPICRGNNGNTILMYESGVSYDRVGPNLFAQSSISEFDLFGNGNYTTEGRFMTLQVVSPTRMILSNARAEADGCTSASVIYLDFVRDDPNVRCGQIIYIDPFTTPEAPAPTPAPQNVDPPVEGQYQVRLGTLSKACDPAAKPFAPNFTTAGLSLSPENKLVVDAASIKYELELSTLTYPYASEKAGGAQDRLGIFTLQQPVDSSFGLMMTLVQMPGQQWTGTWLVTNEDATKLCGGSIDLLPPQ